MELELLVDTGSIYTWIKSDKLLSLRIKPMDKGKFRTIENKIIEREIGEAIIECMDKKATTIVVFAKEKDNEVLGLYALEGLRLEVDSLTKQLKEFKAILAL